MIPAGRVATYGDVARQAGLGRARGGWDARARPAGRHRHTLASGGERPGPDRGPGGSAATSAQRTRLGARASRSVRQPACACGPTAGNRAESR